MGRLLNAIPRWLAGQVTQALNALWGLLSASVLWVPDVTRLPQVQRLTATSTVVVNTGFVLAVIAAGVLLMTRETLQVRYGIGDLGPRLVVGFVAANLAASITRALIDAANALTTGLTGEDIAQSGAFSQLSRTVSAGMGSPSGAALVAAIGLVIAVLIGMLIVLWLVRLGVLITLAGLAPVALACHSLPLIDAVAKLWWRAMLGTLGTVVLQAFGLHAALSVFLDPNANVADLGLPADQSGVLNLFIVACLLWAVVKIPGMMRRYITGGGRSAVGGYVLRVLVVQRLTNGLLRGLRGPAASRPGPSRPGPSRPGPGPGRGTRGGAR